MTECPSRKGITSGVATDVRRELGHHLSLAVHFAGLKRIAWAVFACLCSVQLTSSSRMQHQVLSKLGSKVRAGSNNYGWSLWMYEPHVLCEGLRRGFAPSNVPSRTSCWVLALMFGATIFFCESAP